MMMVMIIIYIIIENVPSTCIQNLVRDPHPKLHSWLLRYTHTHILTRHTRRSKAVAVVVEDATKLCKCLQSMFV